MPQRISLSSTLEGKAKSVDAGPQLGSPKLDFPLGGGLLNGELQPLTGILKNLELPLPQPFGLKEIPGNDPNHQFQKPGKMSLPYVSSHLAEISFNLSDPWIYHTPETRLRSTGKLSTSGVDRETAHRLKRTLHVRQSSFVVQTNTTFSPTLLHCVDPSHCYRVD